MTSTTRWVGICIVVSCIGLVGFFFLRTPAVPAHTPVTNLTQSDDSSVVVTPVDLIPPTTATNEATAPTEGSPTTEAPLSTEPITQPISTPSTRSLARIVFAADFASDGGCADHSETDACDLFTATLNLQTGEVGSVKQITDTSVSESYPVWNPNGSVAYASVFETYTKKFLHFVNLTTSETGRIISNATWPDIHPDGSTLFYVTSDTHLLMQTSLSSDGLNVGTSTKVTGSKNQEDPDVSPDGQSIVFHQIGSDGAHGVVLDRATESTVAFSDRSGHCAFSGSGDFVVCDNSRGGGLYRRTYTNKTLGESSLFVADLKPSQIAVYDNAFTSCGGTSFNYPTFCGDDTHLLASTSCNTDTKGGVSFSRLFLIDVSGSTPVYHAIGNDLADAFDGPGKSSWTVDCLP